MAGGALLGGGLIGGIISGVGSAVEAYQARAQADRSRRRFREGVRRGEAFAQKETYDVLQSPEFQTVRSFALGTYGVQNPGNVAGGPGAVSFGGRDFLSAPTGRPASVSDKRTAASLARDVDAYLTRQRALSAGVDSRGRPLSDSDRSRLSDSGADIRNTLLAAGSLDAGGSNEFAAALARRGVNISDYQQLAGRELGNPRTSEQQLDTGGGIVETPLTQAFRQQIRQTQAARGIYDSQAAAAAEASGLAAFQYEQQRNMLPFLLQMSTFGNDIYHRYETANISREVQKQTGGVGVYGAANPFVTGQSVIGAAFGGVASGALAGASLGVNLQNYLGGGAQRPGYGPPNQSAPFGTYR